MSRHMVSRRQLLTLGAALTASTALGGCITLLPNVDPVQLYRFGFNADLLKNSKDIAAEPVTGDELAEVYISGISLPKAAAGDGILTTENSLVSYIEGARWASPADTLFESAVSEGFDRVATTVRLSDRGRGAAKYRLDIQVRRFETAYAKRQPTVVIALDVAMVRLSNRTAVAHKYLLREIKAGSNRVGEIVPAYEEATTLMIADIVAFAEETAKAQMLVVQSPTS
ncbi:ABC-type transport auxiliary lipoprotein family protein [Asticcacaulis machinosus]|uniref:ABC-type transport auxiliary lipoprotein family protein n=1 Tax=Asticcacaulis machinosus TaxID=2984211 RepID=A0ABT5HE52_9CAUL|nr:ABC-type transport auxiliary lipoprotein family protein [Asticcacaulis machinosus]MDC7674534.1 ABC-type transport auxiliary lipoprotein family protein [Asticcacaulis machinosus]